MAASAGSGCADERDRSSSSGASAALRVLIRRYRIGEGRAQSHRESGARLDIKEGRPRPRLEREALHWLRELPRARAPGA
jgi:hypothetical protein